MGGPWRHRPGRAVPPLADSPLGRTIATTATDIWNDSCAVDELEYAISYGAVGATANPTIVADVWKADPGRWRDRVRALAEERPDATEIDLAWAIVEEMSLRAAPLLRPAFDASGGRQGRLSMQTDPTLFRSFDRMLAQGEHFAGARAEHHRQVPGHVGRRPGDGGGDLSRRERQRHGVVQRRPGRRRRRGGRAGLATPRGRRALPVDDMGPVITVMMGRLEDWLRVQTERDGIVADPTALPWSGVAVFKRTVAEFRARGLRARPLGAAIRHHLHWSELIGGDVDDHDAGRLAAPVQRLVGRGPAADGRSDRARPILDELQTPLPGFRPGLRARRVLTPTEFDTFGPSARTLRAFVGSYHELLHQVGDALVPNPDVKPPA